MSLEAPLDLSSLRELLNTSPLSRSRKPTPLATYLIVIAKSNRAYYSNGMEGAKSLATYLAPIEFPVEKYPAIDDSYNVPDYLVSYELQQLAKILTPPFPGEAIEDRVARIQRTQRAILITTYNEVIPCLY